MDKRKRIIQKQKKYLEWYSFIILSIIAVFLFTYSPMVSTIRYSFSEVDVVGKILKFVGLYNYEKIFAYTNFAKSILNTFILAILGLLVIPLGFIFACLINGITNRKIQGIYRVCYYLPHIISGVSVVMILQTVLKANNGIFNSFLSLFVPGDVTIGWLSDVKYSKFGATIITVWSGLGYSILLNLASLQAIPSELYEAAAVDGANEWKKLIHITVPNMKMCFLFQFLTGMISGFARFSDLFILGGNSASGKPAGSLQTMMMFVYDYGYTQSNYGMSSAAAVILFIFSFVFSIYSAKISGFFKDE